MNSKVASALCGFGTAHSPPKTPTGVNGFDNKTFGGLPKRRPALVCGSPGCGKTLFAMTFRVNGTWCCDEPAAAEHEGEKLVAFLGEAEEHEAGFGRDWEAMRPSWDPTA